MSVDFLATCSPDLLAKLGFQNILHGGLYIISYCCLNIYDQCDSSDNIHMSVQFCESDVWHPMALRPYKTEREVLLSHFHEEAWGPLPRACGYGRIHFLVVVGQRPLVACWLSATGQTQLLEFRPHSFLHACPHHLPTSQGTWSLCPALNLSNFLSCH